MSLMKWNESEKADQFISISWQEEFTRGIVFDVLPYNGENPVDLLKNKYEEIEINVTETDIFATEIYKKDDPKLILEIMRTMEWQLQGGIIGTVGGAIAFFENNEMVQKLAKAYPEQISAEYIKNWVEKLVAQTFQTNFSYFHDLTIAGILTALATHRDE